MSRIVIGAAFSLLLGACVAAPMEKPPEPMQAPIVGGYSPASGTEAGYKAAEALAIDTIYQREPQRSLVETKSAQVQVVAGMNFLFDIKMSGQNRYRIRIYQDLQGKMEVSEFTNIGRQ